MTADTSPPYFLLNELAVSTYNTAFQIITPHSEVKMTVKP